MINTSDESRDPHVNLYSDASCRGRLSGPVIDLENAIRTHDVSSATAALQSALKTLQSCEVRDAADRSAEGTLTALLSIEETAPLWNWAHEIQTLEAGNWDSLRELATNNHPLSSLLQEYVVSGLLRAYHPTRAQAPEVRKAFPLLHLAADAIPTAWQVFLIEAVVQILDSKGLRERPWPATTLDTIWKLCEHFGRNEVETIAVRFAVPYGDSRRVQYLNLEEEMARFTLLRRHS